MNEFSSLIHYRRNLPDLKQTFFNTNFDKNGIKELVSWYLKNFGEKNTINFVEKLKTIGFYYATKAGISLGIEDLEIPPEKSILMTQAYIKTRKIEEANNSGFLTSVEKSQFLIDTWNQTSDILRQNAVQNFRVHNSINPVYMMAFSGARGNISQVRQLVAMRGLMADPQGAILEFPIQSNFREGLTITEYLISCYGARKGLVDTALRTATSGYLTRRLVDCAQHAIIAMIDCGTNQGINISGNNIENRLIGRILAKYYSPFNRGELISLEIANHLAKNYKNILIRSPLTCEASTSICQYCYGVNLSSGKLIQIGEAVGVIAAQSIGEPGTQLTMRTFHTGGVGIFANQGLKPIYASYSGKVIFESSIPGHFVRTPYGKIAYMVKYNSTDSNKILFRILPVDNPVTQVEIFTIKENDLPSGSILFIKNGEIVNTRQLLAQASHLKLTKHKLPESSHPVYSSFEGQIFFESINLSIEKEIFTEVSEFESSKRQITQNKLGLNKNQIDLPDIRRLTKIGSFWILSASNQYEIHRNSSFIEPGDLISEKTPLFFYEFYSPFLIQLKKFNSKLVFGLDIFEIPIIKINFLNGIYKFELNNINKEYLVFQNINNKDGRYYWYPINKINGLQNQYSLEKKSFFYAYISAFYKQNSFRKDKLSKGIIFRIFSKTSKAKNLYFAIFLNILNSKIFFPKKVSLKFFNFKISHEIINKNPKSNFRKNSNISSVIKKHQEFKFKRILNYYLNFEKLYSIKLLQSSGWIYVNKLQVNLKKQQFLPTGLFFNQYCFGKKNISLKTISFTLNNLRKKYFLIKKLSFTFFNQNLEICAQKDYFNRNWYKKKSLKSSTLAFSNAINFEFIKPLNLNAQFFKSKINNKLQQDLIWYSSNNNVSKNSFQIHRRQHKFQENLNLILVQNIFEYTYPINRVLNTKKFKFFSKKSNFNTKNPIFFKQEFTSSSFKIFPKLNYLIKTPTQSNWFSYTNLFNIKLKLSTPLTPLNSYISYQPLLKTRTLGLKIFNYTPTKFKYTSFSCFQIFQNNWISPKIKFNSGWIKNKTLGEFRYKFHRPTGTWTSSIRISDLKEFNKLSRREVFDSKVGKLIRWGQEISIDEVSVYNGQIISKNRDNFIIRLGMPILASTRGVLNINHNELVQKNQLVITLKSRRLQTEDIVQGIPKIEQLFEARESQSGEILMDTVHLRLKNSFVHELKLLHNEHWSIAVDRSFLVAQEFLVKNIIEAYGNQGVKLNEKHVEVIVRQMTSRVRILEPGESGLLPGELVQYHWLKKYNEQLRIINLHEATYEPIVLGISKSVLQSESFLLAASFQEVSRVLVKSALAKKRDFLDGLHENVIVGQLIPAGTGLLSQYKEKFSQLKNLNSFNFTEKKEIM